MENRIKEKDKTWTIIEIVKWMASYFEKKGIDSSRLKAEQLICYVLDISRIEIYSNFDKPLSQRELSVLKDVIKRAINHEPIQMIIGKVPFHNIELNINNSVIVPRNETEQLVEIIFNNEKEIKNPRILDIGTGSGCIALSLAKGMPDSAVTAIDISAKALELASKNAEKNKIKNVTFSRIDVSYERIEGKFDIIVSNPPYIDYVEFKRLDPEVRLFEPESALTDGEDGLTFYRKFAEIFPNLLEVGGRFYLEIGWGQSKELENIFTSAKFETEILKDQYNISRFIKGKII